jgi:hypothetical protein
MQAASKAVLLAALWALAGCKASASASLKTSADESADIQDTDEPSGDLVQSQLTSEPDDLALLGARHDLRLAAPAKAATCRCVAVALGTETDPAIQWRSLVPRVDPTAQLVVALSSEGIACPGAPKDSLGASYWGYRRSGDDVIVVVEAARSGRPVTAGAIIPRPSGAGQVYLTPLDASAPYGRALDGSKQLCALGNPGGGAPPGRASPNAARSPAQNEAAGDDESPVSD